MASSVAAPTVLVVVVLVLVVMLGTEIGESASGVATVVAESKGVKCNAVTFAEFVSQRELDDIG